MADAVANGGKKMPGAEPTVFTAAEFSADKMTAFDAIALGCPSMGAEELEETEFAPMFASCEPYLKDRKWPVWFLRLGRRRMDAKMGTDLPG